MTTYDVRIRREDGVWFADVDGLPAHLVGATDVPRFADRDVEVRDLVAGLTDTAPDEFELRWRIDFGHVDVTGLIVEFEVVEHDLDVLEARRDELRRELIRVGLAAKLPQSAIADVLGLSQQRVHQLASAS